MRWYNEYYLEVKVHQILIQLLHFLKICFVRTLFPDNLGGEFDNGMVQRILF